MTTDPKNADYSMELGATRNYEPWREKDKAVALSKAQREEEERGNAMKVCSWLDMHVLHNTMKVCAWLDMHVLHEPLPAACCSRAAASPVARRARRWPSARRSVGREGWRNAVKAC